MIDNLPENFDRLHAEEERLRSESIGAIKASENLQAHAIMIERSMDLLTYFCLQHKAADEDTLTVQLLGIRVFNGAASALKLLMSGYYQASALQQRDLLETAFLLSYFQSDRALIAQWRGSDGRARQKNFAPVVVRRALDDRDGFTERKRDKAYKLLCELAGHPTHAGFRMLTNQHGGDAKCGPFFDASSLKAVYEELVKLLVQAAGTFTMFFKVSSRNDYAMKLSFMEAQNEWMEKFFNRSMDRAQLDELRALAKAAGVS